MTIIVMRHFEDSKSSHDGLSSRGREQAREIGQQFDRLQCGDIFSSPALRCISTAKIIAKDDPSSPTIEPKLLEPQLSHLPPRGLWPNRDPWEEYVTNISAFLTSCMRKQTALPTLWIAHSGTIDALIEGIVGHGAANLEADSTYGQCLVIDRPPSDPWLGLALRAFNVDLPNAINFSKRIVT
ncbi:TPA: histidine phosphatase family protein [Corynebacterium striatum]|nr:histidine phosphatase family protein [Corynebacterium striatum]HAT1477435.1 histidine phosphatase family protein [Corynebacterium striatum]HAT6526668.1 histidine phosphatase family protein [Corynebacterium striatum]HAT6564818.1 histidine phosphatase family protein [Corynebacterium striatum]HAT6570214.1 histidine phosphatase family protein [Corynebacterium striatum]